MTRVLANASASDRPATDFYSTPPEVTIALLNFLRTWEYASVWECASGKGMMAETIKSYDNRKVVSTELYDMGYGTTGVDFLTAERPNGVDVIITNPPFGLSESFIRRALELNVPFAFVLKSQYWHSSRRRSLFEERTPMYVLPLTWRPDFLFGAKAGAPTMDVLWTVWGITPCPTRYVPLSKPLVKK